MQACTPAFSPHTYQSRRTVLALGKNFDPLFLFLALFSTNALVIVS